MKSCLCLEALRRKIVKDFNDNQPVNDRIGHWKIHAKMYAVIEFYGEKNEAPIEVP